MRSNMLKHRTLLMVTMLPLVWLASMPIGYCVCPSGRTAMALGGQYVGCDCSCASEASCCRSAVSANSQNGEPCVCSHACRRSVIEPAFTSAVSFEWNLSDLGGWVDFWGMAAALPQDRRVSAIAEQTILPTSNLYLEHCVLRL